VDARGIYSASSFERAAHGEGHEDTEYISSISDRKEKDMSEIQYGLRDIFSEPMFTNDTKTAPTLRHRHNRCCKYLGKCRHTTKDCCLTSETNDCHHQPHFLSTREPNGQPVPAITHLAMAKISATMESRRQGRRGVRRY